MVKNTLGNKINKLTKMDKTSAGILVVSLALIVVVLTLVLRKCKREGFALLKVSDASWVTKGKDGEPGEAGEAGAAGAQGPAGNQGPAGPAGAQGEDYIPSQQDKDNMYNEFKDKIMRELADKKIISREGTKYFPAGVINMQHRLVYDRKKITTSNMSGLTYFHVKYNKQSLRSYVKITYTIPMTGVYFHRGAQFRVYVKEPTVSGDIRISSTVSTAGAYTGGWDRVVPKSITVTGIDAGPHAKQREYYITIGNYGNNNHNIMINGVEHSSYQRHKYNGKYYMGASVLVEEIVLPTYNAQNIKNVDFKLES